MPKPEKGTPEYDAYKASKRAERDRQAAGNSLSAPKSAHGRDRSRSRGGRDDDKPRRDHSRVRLSGGESESERDRSPTGNSLSAPKSSHGRDRSRSRGGRDDDKPRRDHSRVRLSGGESESERDRPPTGNSLSAPKSSHGRDRSRSRAGDNDKPRRDHSRVRFSGGESESEQPAGVSLSAPKSSHGRERSRNRRGDDSPPREHSRVRFSGGESESEREKQPAANSLSAPKSAHGRDRSRNRGRAGDDDQPRKSKGDQSPREHSRVRFSGGESDSDTPSHSRRRSPSAAATRERSDSTVSSRSFGAAAARERSDSTVSSRSFGAAAARERSDSAVSTRSFGGVSQLHRSPYSGPTAAPFAYGTDQQQKAQGKFGIYGAVGVSVAVGAGYGVQGGTSSAPPAQGQTVTVGSDGKIDYATSQSVGYAAGAGYSGAVSSSPAMYTQQYPPPAPSGYNPQPVPQIGPYSAQGAAYATQSQSASGGYQSSPPPQVDVYPPPQEIGYSQQSQSQLDGKFQGTSPPGNYSGSNHGHHSGSNHGHHSSISGSSAHGHHSSISGSTHGHHSSISGSAQAEAAGAGMFQYQTGGPAASLPYGGDKLPSNPPVIAPHYVGASSGQGYGGGLQSGQSYGGEVQSGQSYGGEVQSGQSYGGEVQSVQSYGAGLQVGQSYGGRPQTGQSYGGGVQTGQSYGGGVQTGQNYGGGPGPSYGDNSGGKTSSGSFTSKITKLTSSLGVPSLSGLSISPGAPPPMVGAPPPPSPALNPYYGTYQSISPMPSPTNSPQHSPSPLFSASGSVSLGKHSAQGGFSLGPPAYPKPQSSSQQSSSSSHHHTSSSTTSSSTFGFGGSATTSIAGTTSHGSNTPSRLSSPEPERPYNPAADAKLILEELKHTFSRPSAQPLIDILPTLTPAQLKTLRSEYKSTYRGVNLAKHIKQVFTTSTPFGKLAFAVALGPYESEAWFANSWYQKKATRNELLIESLMGKTNRETEKIKSLFKDAKYNASLEQAVAEELPSNKFRMAVSIQLSCMRMEDDAPLVDSGIREDVARLGTILERGASGGETEMIKIIVNRSDVWLVAVSILYRQVYERDLAKAIMKHSKNLVGETLLHVLNGAINRPLRDAKLLDQAIKAVVELDREDLLISRATRIHWDPKHTRRVKREFRKKYHVELGARIIEATKGSYREFLLGMFRED